MFYLLIVIISIRNVLRFNLADVTSFYSVQRIQFGKMSGHQIHTEQLQSHQQCIARNVISPNDH
jgi:hypothetical protein